MTNQRNAAEAVAFAMWKADAVRAAPNVGKHRTIEQFREELPQTQERWMGLAHVALASLPDASEQERALNGYRAAVSYISADSWDGCSDCIEILRAARSADYTWDWAADTNRIAAELKVIRPFCHRDIPAPSDQEKRMREALERINKAPTVMDGGSIQWCRNLAAKTLRALGEEKAS